MTVSAQPGCWGTAARLPNKPGSQKLTPFSSAKEMAGSEVTTPIASAVRVINESRDDRSRHLRFSSSTFFIVAPEVAPEESWQRPLSPRPHSTKSKSKLDGEC